MTLDLFRLLAAEVQLRYTLVRGTYLASRWQSEQEGGINLYHCADEGRGFFVEVGVDIVPDQIVVLRSFSDSEPLEDYAQGVRLPGQ